MKKFYVILAAVAGITLTSCTSNEYLGEVDPTANQYDGSIQFDFNLEKLTRADDQTGGTAASTLGNTFYVYGIKSESTDLAGNVAPTNTVFKNYVVKYTANTAYTTTSNTENWEYVGLSLTAKEAANITANVGTDAQTIKYWDWGAPDYTFYAFSAKSDDIENNRIQIVKNQTETGSVYDNGYTVTYSAAADLDKLFFAERVRITKGSNTDRAQDNTYGGNVTFRFHNTSTKVRVAMYETIPGHTVTINSFKVTNAANPAFSAMTTGEPDNFAANFVNNAEGTPGTLTVKYVSTTGATLNHPTVEFTPTSGTPANVLNLGAGLKEDVVIGTSVPTATYDKTDDPLTTDVNESYTTVFPKEDNTQNLKLKVNYTLTADGTGETITVQDATAEIPAEYLKWKPGYCYTYIFKINDNSNGSTGTPGTDPAGLYPITFDAAVVIDDDGLAEYITTVSEPSITTFGVKNSKYSTGKNEYETGTDIYITIEKESSVVDPVFMSDTHLYKVATFDATNFPITEASVAEAYDHPTGNKITVGTCICTPWSNESKASKVTSVPAEDGTTITMNALKFSPAAGDEGTYAVQYSYGGTDYLYTAVTGLTDGDPVSGYYESDGAVTPTYTLTSDTNYDSSAGKTYYDRIVSGTGTKRVYKIIKVVAP